MDFIMDLLGFNSFDSILVVVDHFTKMVHFIPFNKPKIGEKRTNLFFDHVFHYHGLLEKIVYDHGLQFIPKF